MGEEEERSFFFFVCRPVAPWTDSIKLFTYLCWLLPASGPVRSIWQQCNTPVTSPSRLGLAWPVLPFKCFSCWPDRDRTTWQGLYVYWDTFQISWNSLDLFKMLPSAFLSSFLFLSQQQQQKYTTHLKFSLGLSRSCFWKKEEDEEIYAAAAAKVTSVTS